MFTGCGRREDGSRPATGLPERDVRRARTFVVCVGVAPVRPAGEGGEETPGAIATAGADERGRARPVSRVTGAVLGYYAGRNGTRYGMRTLRQRRPIATKASAPTRAPALDCCSSVAAAAPTGAAGVFGDVSASAVGSAGSPSSGSATAAVSSIRSTDFGGSARARRSPVCSCRPGVKHVMVSVVVSPTAGRARWYASAALFLLAVTVRVGATGTRPIHTSRPVLAGAPDGGTAVSSPFSTAAAGATCRTTAGSTAARDVAQERGGRHPSCCAAVSSIFCSSRGCVHARGRRCIRAPSPSRGEAIASARTGTRILTRLCTVLGALVITAATICSSVLGRKGGTS